ncbi:MAG: anthranilate phosphoribosyltransferase [Solirubrobacteraceae bacterium]|jgi:anthranilate phosphoribosyltransferase|nr:anthranilate phosphoribosyltransferase [Solirubrobacteraceae bacterium]
MTDIPDATVTRALDRVASGRDLTADEAAGVLGQIMAGDVSQAQIAGFLIGLRTKGETTSEIVGFARTMRSLATAVHADAPDQLLDTAGTGGGRTSFNVSTTAALIAAGAGCRVAKHGNRSATSLSGSADLLEALGARIDLGPEAVARCIEEAGFGFMFAPAHHQATRFVVPVRKQLGVRTIFNFLGPLTNPAGAGRQLIGVSDPAFTEVIAGALDGLGAVRGLIVSSDDGLDELSAAAPTKVTEVGGGAETRRYTVTPAEVGIETIDGDGVPGGTPAENAQTTRMILAGRTGPAREMALINSGAAIYAAGRAETIAHGVELARAAIDDGAAAAVLDRFVALTVELSGALA